MRTMRKWNKLNVQKSTRWDEEIGRSIGGSKRYGPPTSQRHDAKPACIVMLLTLGISAVAHAVSPIDANSLVSQMVAKYQSFQTLQENSETKIVSSDGQEFIQTATIKYKRPNLIYAESRDPKQGTLMMASNGRLATFYSGKQNAFTQRNAAPTIIGTMTIFSHASVAMTGLPQNQMLSPLSFLAAKRMPVEASDYRYVKTDVVDGKRAALIAAVADTNWLKTLFPVSTQVTFQKRDILLWIDLNTGLLVRASCDLVWYAENGNQRGPGRMHSVETHHNVIPNAPLRDEDFNVAPPKGAEEVFPAVR